MCLKCPVEVVRNAGWEEGQDGRKGGEHSLWLLSWAQRNKEVVCASLRLGKYVLFHKALNVPLS